jgi:hypothetical protein
MGPNLGTKSNLLLLMNISALNPCYAMFNSTR